MYDSNVSRYEDVRKLLHDYDRARGVLTAEQVDRLVAAVRDVLMDYHATCRALHVVRTHWVAVKRGLNDAHAHTVAKIESDGLVDPPRSPPRDGP